MSFFKKPLIFILVAGILIRLVLSAITFHSDVQHFDLAGYVLGKGNLLNFYDYPASLNKNDQLLKSYPADLFNYPPAAYFFIGTLDWLLTGWTDVNFHNNFLFNFQKTLGDSQLYLHLILLKIPYLPFDLLIAYLFYNLFSTKREKVLAFTLWIFNPWVLYSTYMVGQFDVIPTAFVVLVLYVLNKKIDLHRRVFLAAFFLGIGASFKIYPLLFLLPVAFLLPTWSKRLQTIFLGSSIYAVTILLFISSSGYRSTALAANQTFKSLYAQIPISGAEGIILFVSLTGFFYLIFLYRAGTIENLWQRFFIIILLFFIFTHYHPQWFLWLTPFLIIELLNNNFRHLFLVGVIAVAFAGSVSLFEPSLSIGLFVPLNPMLWDGPNLWKSLSHNFDPYFMKSLFQSIFVCAAGFLIYQYFPKESLTSPKENRPQVQ